MKRVSDFFNSKGFYMALTTGIVAFAGLMVMYNYNSKKQNSLNKQAIDLNQPVVADSGDASDKNADEQMANNKNSQNSNAQTAKNDVNDSNQNEEKTEQVTSNAAKASIASGDVNKDSIGDANPDHELVISQDADISNEITSNTAVASNGELMVPSMQYNGEQELIWPVPGNVILPYSMETTVYFKTLKAYKCNPAMLIGAEEGTSVFAAYEGIVKDISDTKEYGTVVTIDMGNGYEAKYGQLANVCVAVNDVMTMAGKIGDVAKPSSYYAEEGAHLYFAIEKDGEPVNPMSLMGQ